MAGQIVYDDFAESARLQGQLFAGKKFWVAQRVPTRNYLLDLIKSNGGDVVKLEKSADYMIADHFRRDCPPGSISYTFIDKSIKNGAVEAPESHPAGPPAGTVREAGSIVRPAKGARVPYTAEDDRILYEWVRDHQGKLGLVGGNELYMQLEKKVGPALCLR